MRSEEAPGRAGRLLSASHRRGTFDLYSLDIDAGGVRHAEPDHSGVVEHLVVVEGRMRVGPQSGPVDLDTGDLVSSPPTCRTSTRRSRRRTPCC